MAGNTVSVELKVQDSSGSMKARTKEAKDLNKELSKLPTGTKTGAGAYKATSSPASYSGMGETKTSRSIGGGAGTGSASSDFAAQAQGLGGLVHVYATFAANLFAVSAAFNALSRAMDITNLVKGLDQIGASSGKNLGSLAKQMVSVADGALSMQQAMTSTAMASAGGMSNANIIRMTQVAKNAALALGRDLPDSMDRLTKGIIKTQPELLDELGIMTRVIPAQQAYAQQIGKTISSLTDFEKRQAFANAVLAEGEAKFGAISMEANPYTKVLASIQNLMQGGLELVNKVLGPLMSMLSASPTGLAVALGGIAAVLLKQAIPAIGMFRENAKRMEQETHARVQKQIEEQRDAASQSDTIAAKRAEREYSIAGAGAKRIADLRKAQYSSAVLGSEVRGLLKKSPLDLTEDESNKIAAKHSALYDKIIKGVASKEESDQYRKLEARKTAVTGLTQDITKIGDAAAHANELQDSKWWSHQEQKEAYLKKLETKAAKSTIVSSAAENAAVMGPMYAFSKLKEDLKDLDAGKLAKVGTGIRGGLSIVSSAVGTAVNAFGMWGQAIAAAGVVLGLLDGVLSESAKELAAYNNAIDTLESSFANIDRTIEVISKKDPLSQMSIESTQAKANALNDLSESLSNVIDKFDKLIIAQGAWDKAKDWVMDMFGQGNADKLAAGMSMTIVEALKVMEEGPAKEAAKTAISNILGQPVDLNNFKQINATIKDLDEGIIANKSKAINSLLKTVSREANNAASNLTAFKTALTDIGKQSIAMSNKLIPTDDFSKIGIELGKASNSLNEALKDPINSLKALAALSKDTATLSLLPPGLNAELGAASKQIDEVLTRISELRTKTSESQSKVAVAQETIDSNATDGSIIGWIKQYRAANIEAVYAAKQIVSSETALLETSKKALDSTEKQAANLRTQFESIGTQFAEASFNNLAKGFKIALQEASIISAKGYLEVMKAGKVGTAAFESKIAQAEYKVQLDMIDANFAVVMSQESLKVSIDALRLASERASLLQEQKLARETGDTDLLKRTSIKLTKNYSDIEDAGKRLATITRDPKVLSKEAIAGKMSPETAEAMKNMPGLMAQIMGMQGQKSKIYAGMGAEKLTSEYKKFAEQQDLEKATLATNITNLETDKSRLQIAEKLSSTYQEDIANAILKKDVDILSTKQASDNLEFAKEQKALDLARTVVKGDELKKTNEAQEALNAKKLASESRFAQEREALEAAGNEKRKAGLLEISKLDAQYALNKATILNTQQQAQLDVELETVRYKQAAGQLSEKEANTLITTLSLTKQKLAYEKELASLADKRAAVTAAEKALAEQTAYNATHAPSSDRRVRQGTMESGIPYKLEDAQGKLANAKVELAGATQAATDSNNAIVTGITRTSEAIISKGNWVAGAQKSLQDYAGTAENVFSSVGDVVTKAFKGMEDALTDFVMTGKLDFASLANSIIADMVRIAIQQSITGPLAAAAMSFFPMAKGGVIPMQPGGGYAKGGAFDQGIPSMAFAKGDAFTNSIVSTPTLFKFAQGTGLMGEAGPEAIMPLKRDNNGNLGVRAQTGGTGNQVVINIIESSEKAGTQERKVENNVDMINIFVEKVKSAIASDITRGSGSVPGAMSRTYGLNRVAGAY